MIYTNTVEEILQQCLALVRSAEDVEDDEYLDGTIRRNWLSQFEFVKVFSLSPPPPFLSWLDLWQRLPVLDKGGLSISAITSTAGLVLSWGPVKMLGSGLFDPIRDT